MKRLRIAIEELPPRPSEATEAEYSAVFGGCIEQGGACSKSEGECCNGMLCHLNWPFSNDGHCFESLIYR